MALISLITKNCVSSLQIFSFLILLAPLHIIRAYPLNKWNKFFTRDIFSHKALCYQKASVSSNASPVTS
ncbi:hypothetical protein S1OALGB6SA_1219 [Olavius algarvensis spirochete endosymbiont]|nr:hypothetical protein S1OALGB6SA_1219 [Olavius algarvensis spirochete endosymbiont]